jgi:hypothetical protein
MTDRQSFFSVTFIYMCRNFAYPFTLFELKIL